MSNPIKHKLKNGLKIIYFHTENDPISACHLFLPQGAWDEDQKNYGSSVLMWSLLPKGTKKRNARQLAEDTEAIGAHVGGGAALDYSHMSCQSIGEYFPKALSIMQEELISPGFPTAEIEKEKESQLASIKAKKEHIFTVAQEELNKHMFKDHPYHRPATGYDHTVSNISEKQIHQRHKSIVKPTQAIMSIASNHPWEKIEPELEKYFGPDAWPGDTNKPQNTLADVDPGEMKNVDVPFSFEQAFLILGFPAAKVLSPDYLKLKFLGSLLGGGMSSRLFQSLREKKGLAYDVGAFYPTKKKGSLFACYMGLQAERLQEAHEGIINELNQIKLTKPTQSEIDQVRNFMKGSYILDHQTNSQRAYYLGWWELIGLKEEFDRKYTSILDKITPEQIQEVAQKYLSSDPITVKVLSRN